MANPEHLEILKQGVQEWNKWREECPDVSPDLREADLRRLDLGGANLVHADLSGAKFVGAKLGGAKLDRADLGRAFLVGADLNQAALVDAHLNRAILVDAHLGGADLSGADLLQADLSGADLSGANLRGASLWQADLTRADLSGAHLRAAGLGAANLTRANLNGANFSGAQAVGTIFADVNLSVAKGLEAMEHVGPSTVGIDTIFKSRGEIPEVFLRGCGVPDEFIKSLPSLVANGFYSCFISYSTKDQEFADRLYADLQAKGVRCWFAPHDIQGGKTIHEQIDEAIRRYDQLLLILSEHSIHSGWVETEIANAWERQIQQEKHVLFPVRLVSFEELEKWKCPDPKTGKELGREIRKYFIPDFSNWKDHDSYQEAFQRLVESLKAESGAAG